MDRFNAVALNLLRIMAGVLFVPHGAQKLFGMFGASPAELLSRQVAGVIECFGGLAIVLGLLTRPVAFVASGLMASAYFMVHVYEGFWPIVNDGELPVLYCFVFLFLAAHGGGNFSIDGLFRERRRKMW